MTKSHELRGGIRMGLGETKERLIERIFRGPDDIPYRLFAQLKIAWRMIREVMKGAWLRRLDLDIECELQTALLLSREDRDQLALGYYHVDRGELEEARFWLARLQARPYLISHPEVLGLASELRFEERMGRNEEDVDERECNETAC